MLRPGSWEDPAVPANLTAKACDDPLRKLLYQQAPYQESLGIQLQQPSSHFPLHPGHQTPAGGGPEGAGFFVNFTTNSIVYNKLLSYSHLYRGVEACWLEQPCEAWGPEDERFTSHGAVNHTQCQRGRGGEEAAPSIHCNQSLLQQPRRCFLFSFV